ncbi:MULTISPECIES: TM1812 family CRISPR-associated protein [Pseudomonadota]|uniref:TM1812 family CRISPR-associated protein n=1 Tax=Pseudomonadota TaxID=1224 RepID=UPI001CA67752|nr:MULTISPECIES: TM1812 family CRISPR-associated protein [Pseudomonadota]MBY8964599.1 hypothetical protein [Algiphilus acroporae]MCI5069570.1 TM1812 family CRISPR-associated protein [Acidovorax sp.]MCI5103257.1 TM1812 family CRISPR-associated protein [Algiphilus sp.]
MDRAQQLRIFYWQNANVRKLDTAFKQVRRVLNKALINNDLALVEIQTKLLAFLYSCWTEATFYKLIHTPHCFELDEIEQIKRHIKRFGITAGWKKAVNLSLRHINASGGDIPNRKQRIEGLLREYIEEPSQLRNKIAHGQWAVALNQNGYNKNDPLSNALNDLDFLKVERLRSGCSALAAVVESLFESPDKAFHADYYTVLTEAEERLRTMQSYSVPEHVARLRAKNPKVSNSVA